MSRLTEVEKKAIDTILWIARMEIGDSPVEIIVALKAIEVRSRRVAQHLEKEAKDEQAEIKRLGDEYFNKPRIV